MIARTHDLAAITALGLVALTRPPQTITLATLLVSMFACLCGGIAPDIDQPTAPFWRNLPIGGFFGRIIDKLLGGHRFLTHSLLGLGLFGLLTDMILRFLQPVLHHINTTVVWWAFMVGLVSHLIMDSFTEEGVPWLLPVPIKFGLPPIKSWRIKTGKFFEILVIFPGIIIFDAWYIASHYFHLIYLVHNYVV